MPSRCSAPRCINSNKDGYCLTKFAKDARVRKQWIGAAGEPGWQLPQSAALCEVHFHPTAVYYVGERKYIKKDVIHTFFCKCDIIDDQDKISDHKYSLRSVRYAKKCKLKVESKRSLRQCIHNENCYIKRSLDIKMLNQSLKVLYVKERNEDLQCLESSAYYEMIQVKLNNIMQENEILRERVSRLQDDLLHIKLFEFHVMH